MNAQQLISWMAKPGNLGKEASAQLDTLTQTFPFFQTAHLLYIKSLHNENSFLYNNQLKIAAAYAANRKVLYELITKKEIPVKETAMVVAESSGKQEIAEKEIAEEENKSEKIIQPEFPKKRFGTGPDEWESGMMRQLQLLHHWKTTPQEILAKRIEEINAEKSVRSEDLTPQSVSEDPKPPIAPSAQDEINTLLYVLVEPASEDLAQQEELKDSQEQNESWEIIPVDQNESEKDKVEIKNEHLQIPQDEISQEIIREAISSSIELEVDDTIPSLEELGIQPAVITEKPQIPSDKKNEIENVQDKKSESSQELTFTSWLRQINPVSGSENKPEISTEPAPAKIDLLDKFIKEAPRLSPGKSTFFNPVNMAKKSVQDNDEFLTETLARIYAKQGNISKAIRVYQKLSLKFPEKSVYFAALIEELKRTPNKI